MKKTVLILFGGKSPEHEISVKTAYNVASALNQDLFDFILVGISKSGLFYAVPFEELLTLAKSHLQVTDDNTHLKIIEDQNIFKAGTTKIDVIFPLLHGVQGEDGIPQGFFNMLNIPFVGCDVKASAICMDKDITKTLLKTYSIPVVDWITLRENDPIDKKNIIKTLGLPVFVKASEQGSSIGTYKVSTEEELTSAIQKAFSYGPKVIIEKGVIAREIETAVLGYGNDFKASCLGEIIPNSKDGFYSYDAKYIDPNGATLVIDVNLDSDIKQKIQNYAIKAFKALECSGLSRIDFFLDENNAIFLNEINTMPGFTSISMYPKLWMHDGLTYQDLLTKLIELAFTHFNKKQSYSLV